MTNHGRLSDNDLDALIRGLGEHVDYPPTPDFAVSWRSSGIQAESTMGRRSRATNLAAPETTTSEPGATQWLEPAQQGSEWRQAARLIVAGIAALVVGVLIVLVLREMRSSSPEIDRAGSSELREVFISTFSTSTGANESFSFLLVRDARSLKEVFTVEVDLGGWFTVSPDGAHIYASGDHYLSAIDSATGGTVWEKPLADRRLREFGIPGLATPAMSPDGTRLYLYSTESGFSYRIEELDAATGEPLRTSDVFDHQCNSRIYPSPDGKALYLPCHNDSVDVIDIETLQPQPPLDLEPVEVAQTVSGHALYVLSSDGEIATIDTNAQQVVARAQLLDLPAGDAFPIIAYMALSNDDATLAVALTDDVVRGPTFTYEYRLYEVGSWQEVGRVSPGSPIVAGGLTPDHTGGFLIVEQDEGAALRLDRDGLESLVYDLDDGRDANYQRTVAATIAAAAEADASCPVTPQTANQEIRERYEFGDFRTVEVADMYLNFWGTSYDGESVGYTAMMSHPNGYEEGGWYYITLQFVVPDLDRSVVVSGFRLDTAGDLRFGDSNNPASSVELWPSPGMETIGLGALRRTDARVTGSGCFGIAVQWDDNDETVVFEVVD